MSYQLSEYLLADQRKMSLAKNYFAWQARLVLPHLGRRVVEVGSGIGNFTGLLLDRELVVANDLDPAALGELRNRYGERENLRTVLCDAAGPRFAEVAQFAPDSCVCLNVLEHIADDGAALRNMAKILPPGGVVVLLVPAFPALYGPIDRNLGHFRRYTRRALVAAAEGTGLVPRRLGYVNLAGWFGWWWNARVAGREEQSEAQIAVFDRWIVPVVSRLEALAPAPFGQSLLAVLESAVGGRTDNATDRSDHLDALGNCGAPQILIDCRQRAVLAHGDFKIGGIVGGQTVFTA